MTPAWLALGVLALLGALLLGRGGHHVRRRRLGRATGAGAGGCGCLALAGLGLALGLNLYTYQRLAYEQPVATITFKAGEAGHFNAHLEPQAGTPRTVELQGDEWQLDARVLKWQPWANVLGLDARYRLERLSGRYANVADATSTAPTAYALGTDRGLDVWHWVRRLPGWAQPLDARYGSATYLPMADGARYTVALTQSGLVARPDNGAARTALRRW